MKVIPLMDRVLIKPIEAIQKSNGGIVLTGENGKVTYLHGVILAMGPGKQKANGDYVATPLEIGDRVIYGNVSSTLEDMQDGEKVLLVESNAIVAKLEDDPLIGIGDLGEFHL
tara:strand:- start:416 stop:754 length:339 start_codon:yes stop_codon:yes gene_type:complete